ncbi:MAG: diaminopimelate epimerase [Deltaproteobacteria bacterium]|jgi:diaminopimelate epimerase|nr:diaminopimelate epimerase [Deltaproteobacteria bacterium]
METLLEDLKFYKYSGHGNDFVIIDNWDKIIREPDLSSTAKLLSRKKYGIGADGVVYLAEGPEAADFAARFFNSDGSEASMCGNASRCVAHFAHYHGIAPTNMTFATRAGFIDATVDGEFVRVQLPGIKGPEGISMVEAGGVSRTFHRINTGVAHAVTWVEDLDPINVVLEGKNVRYHPSFAPGTNVDYVKILSDNSLVIRTYEKGVEDETLACGTGCAAAALLSYHRGLVSNNRIICQTRSGERLVVEFQGTPENLEAVFLEGKVRYIFLGQVGPDIFK